MSIILRVISSYALIPVATYGGAAIGAQIGKTLASRAWDAMVNKVRGVVNLNLSVDRIYIILNGEVIELDPRKKYTIVRGEVVSDESDEEWVII